MISFLRLLLLFLLFLLEFGSGKNDLFPVLTMLLSCNRKSKVLAISSILRNSLDSQE